MSTSRPALAPRPYRERLLPSAPVYLLVVVAALTVGLLMVPLSPAAAVVVGPVVLLALVAWLVVSSPVVEVEVPADAEQARLRAGRARIPVALLGEVRELDAEALRRTMGTEADVRAWVCHRPWLHSAVRVDVQDPRDSTPYWVVCTRRPAELVTALGRASSGSGQAAHSEQIS